MSDTLASKGILADRVAGQLPAWLRGPLFVGLVTALLALLALGLTLTTSPLILEVEGQRYQVQTHASTVQEALRHAGLDLQSEDLVTPSLDTPLRPGMVVQVKRAQPVVLNADGQVRHLRTQAVTIAQFLAEAGVEIHPADEILVGDHLVARNTRLESLVAPAQKAIHDGKPESKPQSPPDTPLTIRVQRAAALTLEDGTALQTLRTTLTTVGQVLQEEGITLFLGDKVTPGLQSRVVPGMTVKIERSVPAQIDVDGRLIRTRTLAGTVAGLLGQERIALVGRDQVMPGLAEPIRPDMTVRVTRVREEYAVDFETIPFDTVWVPDPEVEIDNIRLVQEGQLGLTKRRYRVVYENGQQVRRSLEDIWAAQPPITKTMAYGTKIVVRTLDTPEGPIEYWRKMRVYTTSYKPASCGKPKSHPRYGYTRLGWKLQKGIVAIDPSVIPLRTKLYVPGYGLARAGDTGGAVKGKFVDLGFGDDDYESWHWWTDVYLLTPAPPRDKIRWVLPNWPRYPDRGR